MARKWVLEDTTLGAENNGSPVCNDSKGAHLSEMVERDAFYETSRVERSSDGFKEWGRRREEGPQPAVQGGGRKRWWQRAVKPRVGRRN